MCEADALPLGDYVTLTRGTTYKGALVGQHGPALLGLGSIQPGGGFRDSDFKTYGGECPEALCLYPGDTFAALKGATKDGKMIGSVARVPTSVPVGRLTQDTVKLNFTRRNQHLEQYIYWVLRTPQYREYCAGRAMGSAVVAMSRTDFLNYPIPTPTTSRYNLVSLFELIEARITLLRETNATLEAIAQALFKSWFVDFDPVRAKRDGRAPEGMDEATAALFPDSFEDSQLGQVPRGWSYCSLREVARIFDSHRVPLSGADREKRRGEYPYYGAAALMDHVDDYLFDGVFLLTGEDGSVADAKGFPITQYVWGKFWVNNHAHVLQGANGVSTEHLMLALKQTNIQPYITGAVQAKLSQSNMWRIQFMQSSPEVAAAFSDCVAPLFASLRHNADRAQTLAALRDTLLPRLISGQLRPPEAAETLEEALA